MRRLVLTAVASAAVLALVPASALARHHARHHHSRSHHRTHIRHERFGNITTPPATTPAPTTPGAPPADSVGTVTSFTNGVLMLTLNNGSTVSGTVTGDTEIECEGAMDQSMQSAENANCSMANLVPGAFIRGAELGISSAGAVFEKVDLIL
jgi:hypothetical protein